jgi:hypothetical protein
MNNLFEFDEDFNIVIDPQVLALAPFRAVFDKHKDRELALLEMNYIVFLLHYRSDFNDIRDMKERSVEIISSMYRGDEIVIDKITEEAIEFYKKRFFTSKIHFLNSSLDALDKTRLYMDGIDYSEKGPRNVMTYKPKDVIDLIKQSPDLMASIKELENQIKKEQEVEGDIRGSGKKGVYEDG